MTDTEMIDLLLKHYVAVDFADEQFPGQTVLKFAFPNGAAVGADLRATLARFAEPAIVWDNDESRADVINHFAQRRQEAVNAAARRIMEEA